MTNTGKTNLPLIAAGISTATASLLHIAIIFGGPEWYRFFGAGEEMATMAEQGSIIPTAVTLFVATVLMLWSAYALSAAGMIGKLPFRRSALVIISAIFLARGVTLLPLWLLEPEKVNGFWIVSSLICLAIGCCYAIGTRQVWNELSQG